MTCCASADRLRRNHGCVELVGFALALREDLVEFVAKEVRGCGIVTEAQADRDAFVWAECQRVMGARLRPGLLRIHVVFLAVYDVIINAIL